MDLGSQISKHFKASIKQKLKDCGSYIDDELPEYIMVMIANKRQRSQMKDDLSLFLGEETDNFVTWLFEMLTKLQNVAQDDSMNMHHEEIPVQEKSVDLNEKIKMDKAKMRNNKEAIRKNSGQERPDSINDNVEIENDKDTMDMIENANRHESEITVGLKRRNSSEKRRRKSDENLPVEGSSGNRNEVSQRHSSKRRKEGKYEDAILETDQDENNQSQLPSVVTVPKIRPSLPRSRQPSGSLVMKAMKEANQSVATRPMKGSDEIQIEATGLDDVFERRIELKRGNRSRLFGKMASSLIEKEGDENEDNEREVKELKAASIAKSSGDQERSQEDDIELVVNENEFNEEDSESKNKSEQRIVISHEGDENEFDDSEDDKRSCDVEKENSDRRTTEGCGGRIYERKVENYEDDDEYKNRSNRKRKKHKNERSSHREKRKGSPKFIVTLHGALNERMSEERRARRIKDPLFIDLNPNGPMAVFETAQNEIKKMAHQLDLLQNTVPSTLSSCLSSHPDAVPLKSGLVTPICTVALQNTSASIMTVSSRIGTSNLMPPQNGLTSIFPAPSPVILMQTNAGSGSMPKVRLPSREIFAPLENEEIEDDDEGEATDDMESTARNMQERCKFWPNCKNGSCFYVHPSKTCRMFPNCSFKEKCLFIHPMCRFDLRCMKTECPYMHTSAFKKVSPFQQQVSSALKNEITAALCKFIPNCTKSNCPFRHPVAKPCRYGSGCKRPTCQFRHETKPATGDALKWESGTSSNTHRHISDRKFAATEKEVMKVPVDVKTETT